MKQTTIIYGLYCSLCMFISPSSCSSDGVFDVAAIEIFGIQGDEIGKPLFEEKDTPVFNKSNFLSKAMDAKTVEICFLVDITGSMKPYIDRVKDWINDLISELTTVVKNNADAKQSNLKDLQLSFVGYRDFQDEIPFDILKMTSSSSKFAEFLTKVQPIDGGDPAEDVLGGLEKAAQLEWTENAAKFIFHFGDAPCHQESCETGPPKPFTAAEQIKPFRELGIQYYFGEIVNLTQPMLAWFQESYGSVIPIIHFDFDVSQHVAGNFEKKSFVTFQDIRNARVLATKLKKSTDIESQDDLNSLGLIQLPWNGDLFEGDMDLRDRKIEAIVDKINDVPVPETQDDFADLDNAVAEKFRLWPNGYIPYEMDVNFDSVQRATIALAMEQIQDLTCIRWISRRTERDYIVINLGSSDLKSVSCHSAIGRNFGMQEIVFSPQCFESIGIIVHEMMHAIGFLHEQSRSDRDDYVAIQWQNLPNGKDNKDFLTYGVDKIDNLGTNYDYSSVMHYPRVIGGREIVVPLVDIVIGQRDGLSENDIYKIQKLYECNEDLRPVCDPDIDCVVRAEEGQCIWNAQDMLSTCRKYCLLCHRKPNETMIARMLEESAILTTSPPATTVTTTTPAVMELVTSTTEKTVAKEKEKEDTTSIPSTTTIITVTTVISATKVSTPSSKADEALESDDTPFEAGLLLEGAEKDKTSCDFSELPSANAEQYFAAINSEQYQRGEACGACVELVNRESESLVVYINDHCATCEYGIFILSDAAYAKIAPPASHKASGRIDGSQITFRPVPCPSSYISSGPIKIFTNIGSGPWWAAFQPQNMRRQIIKMSLMRLAGRGSTSWLELPRCCGGGYFVYQDGPPLFGKYQLKLEFKSADKEEVKNIIIDMNGVIPGSNVEGTEQN